jgi:hypothetical protein
MRSKVAWLCAVAVIGLVTACDKSPTAPSNGTKPTITAISPSAPQASGTPQTLSLTGTNFSTGMTVAISPSTGVNGTFQYLSSTSFQITGTFAAGSYTLTVTVGSQTATFTFAVQAASLVPLTGIISAFGGARLPGATVTIIDGPNGGRSTVTDGNGNYAFSGLTQGNANVSATASGYIARTFGVFINGTNTLSFSLQTIDPWSQNGSGDNVFNIPTYVSKVKITANFSGFSSNFIVKIANSLIVNELIGTGWGTTHFEGTYLTSGGVVQITNSNGVSWSFTEVR